MEELRSKRLQEYPDLSLSREKSSLRRLSASNLKSTFREDKKSLASSGITISSTVSSPGYIIREEIDPSTYSFTAALKALQAKTVGTWEFLQPYGYKLNPKWSDAERYICNPLSGKVPLECLSTKTLGDERGSFRTSSNRITMSSPLEYHCQSRSQLQAKISLNDHQREVKFAIQEEKEKRAIRDVGIQSTSVDLSSSSPSPAKTPSIEERRPIKNKCEIEAEDSSYLSSEQLNAQETAEFNGTDDGLKQVVQAKEPGDDHVEKKIAEKNAKKKVTKLRKAMMMLCGKREEEESCSCSCISRRSRDKQRSK